MAWMYHQRVGIKKIEGYLSDNQSAPRLERPESSRPQCSACCTHVVNNHE
jgi:hypothetical protein